jgi:integrase
VFPRRFPRGRSMTKQLLHAQADVFRLPAPKTGEAVYFDEGRPRDRAPGLALRIRAAGSRKFVFFYRLGGRLLKYTIGDASGWTLDKARATARDLRVKVERGENPAVERASRRADAALLFSAVARDYLDARKPNMKPRSHAECIRHVNKYWKPFHGMAIASIDRAAVAARLRIIAKDSGAVTADRARSTLSAMFAWAIGEGLCEVNPVTGTNKASDDKPRERLLSDAELAAIWKAAPESDYGRIVRLLMLTAQRREEIGALLWSEVDREAALISLPRERTKNHRSHDVPLSPMALAVLDAIPEREGRALVFGSGQGGYSGWSTSKGVLDESARLAEPWTLHDLRRTAATRMADLGVAPHVIEAILNHVSGHKAGVAGIYNRSTYSAEKRVALELWTGHLSTIIAQADGPRHQAARAGNTMTTG